MGLTDTAIKKAKGKDKPYKLSDGGGMYLLIPRREMALAYFEEGVKSGLLRPDINLNSMIDLLYAPLNPQLQIGLTTLSDAYVEQHLRPHYERLPYENLNGRLPTVHWRRQGIHL